MATSYSTFKLPELRERFGIANQNIHFVPKLPPIAPADWLVSYLEATEPFAITTEKARSELLITPILANVASYFPNEICIYSGEELVGNAAEGLTGICDYIISKPPESQTVNAPVLVVTEAKKQDFDGGFAQCCAELLGARAFNEKAGKPTKVLYGMISTGDTWRVAYLKDNFFVTEKNIYQTENMGKLLAALKWIINESLAQAPNES